MPGFPRSILGFQQQFPDEAACASWLAAARWPDGFRCPECDHAHGWELQTKARTYECGKCRRQTSVTAGTVMHGSKLPLTVWFWAAYLIAAHSNGISTRQLGRQLGLGSYKSAWLLCAKLRRAMVNPTRALLSGLVEVDETQIPYRTQDDPVAGGGGRSPEGKMQVVAAVEIIDKAPGRLRLGVIPDASAASLHPFIKNNVAAGTTIKTDGSAASLHPFIKNNVAAGTTIKTDGSAGYPGVNGYTHESHTVGKMAAHIVLPWVHRVFSNLKTWALGVYHGIRPKHIQAYLDKFVFRFNRRSTPHAAFKSLLGIAITKKPDTYNMLIKP